MAECAITAGQQNHRSSQDDHRRELLSLTETWHHDSRDICLSKAEDASAVSDWTYVALPKTGSEEAEMTS